MRKICTIALFLFLIFPASANADLVAFLDFESQTDDQSGNGVAVSGAISGFVAGHEGLAGSFDGINDFLDMSLDISPGVMPEMTFGAWARTDAFSGLRAIMSADDTSPANFDRQIGLDTRGSGGTLTYSAFAGATQGVLSTNDTLTSNFTFVAARYDGTNVTLFVDGNQITGLDDTDSDATHHPTLRVGKNPFFDQFFDGAIDNAFVFDEALTDAQISDIRANGSTAILSISSIPEPSTAIFLALPWIALTFRRDR